MFLLKLLQHNILLFMAMVLFIIAQLFINYKRGIVVTPFYHYGMYSEEMNVENEYPVFEIMVNGQRLQAENYTPQQWDKIVVPLTYYSTINKSNTLYHTDIKRLMAKIHFSSIENNFLQQCDINSFITWYRLYLQNMLKVRVLGLDVKTHIYKYNSGHLIPTDSVITLAQVCN